MTRSLAYKKNFLHQGRFQTCPTIVSIIFLTRFQTIGLSDYPKLSVYVNPMDFIFSMTKRSDRDMKTI